MLSRNYEFYLVIKSYSTEVHMANNPLYLDKIRNYEITSIFTRYKSL